MAKEYVIYETQDGEQAAHTDSYSPKDGEKEVGRVEADSADKALRKFKRSGGSADSEAADDDAGDEIARREATEEEKQAELDKAREAEESKQDIEVLADSKGTPYVAGEEGDSKKSKGKKQAKPEPPPEPEESSLGTFRAKDAQEAIAKAKGEYKDPAEGPQRGSQTP